MGVALPLNFSTHRVTESGSQSQKSPFMLIDIIKCSICAENVKCGLITAVTVSTRSKNEVVNVQTGLTDESVAGIIGALLTALLIIIGIAIFIALRRRRRRRKYPAGSGFIDGTRNVGGATVKCSAGLITRSGVCNSDGRSYDHAVGGVSNGNVAVVNGNGYDVMSTSDAESDGLACCGGVAGGRRVCLLYTSPSPRD